MTKEELLLEQWKMASELHRHMDNMAWQALNFFIATNGGLFAVLAIVTTDEGFTTGKPSSLVMPMATSLVGVIVSVVWGLLQRRQQAYQYYRGAQAKQAEEKLQAESGERVLTLYQKTVNQLDKEDPECNDWMKRYLKSPTSKLHAHDLLVHLAGSLALVWSALLVAWIVYALSL